MKNLNYFLLIIGISLTSIVFPLEKFYHQKISLIKSAFKNNDKKTIANFVIYPLKREFPIPLIKNKVEFIQRFNDVFDKNIIDLIATSNIDKDWRIIGWRGIAFDNGQIWLNLNGKIQSVNYQSFAEKKIKNQLIEKQKHHLYSSLKISQQPVLEWKTTHFHIQIDKLEENNYRYASWDIQQKTNKKPNLILTHGKVVFEGSGGNYYYAFINGQYIYHCYVNVIGKDSSAGNLTVFKGNNRLLTEKAIQFTNH